MDVYTRMKEIGVCLPDAPDRGGLYSQTKSFGKNLVYVSGCGSTLKDNAYFGKIGGELTEEEGKKAAENAILNVLAVLQKNLGDLNNIKSFVKIIAFIASTPDFYNQPAVADGATKILKDIFGEEVGLPARSAIASNVLPGNIAVEIEAIVEMK